MFSYLMIYICVTFGSSPAPVRHRPISLYPPPPPPPTSFSLMKDRYSEPKREGEWEPIKILLLEGDENSNKANTASNTRLRLTTQVGQAHAATAVLLDLGTNKQPSEPNTPTRTAETCTACCLCCTGLRRSD
jgi:hypothetical protein